MWLLNTTTYQLHFVQDPSYTAYAALSHTWDSAGEQTFQDVQEIHASARAAFDAPLKADDPRLLEIIRSRLSEKIRRCCDYARARGVPYVWADTCCIDKTSSAELSEAINSMFDWYAHAEVCYVFLADVSDTENPEADGSSFRRSRWFRRGWTLQELIVPWGNLFLSKNWRMIGTKASLAKTIEQITGIDLDVLLRTRPLHSVSVARRMSWAADRETTRVEDEAYCLMGIFGVRLPAIYGEGRQAFVRLQEEIVKRIPDQSLLAWGLTLPCEPAEGAAHPSWRRVSADETRASASAYLFASSPREFQHSANFTPIPLGTFASLLNLPSVGPPLYMLTSYGVRTTLPMCTLTASGAEGEVLEAQLAILACQNTDGQLTALILSAQDTPWKHLVGGFQSTQDGLRLSSSRATHRRLSLIASPDVAHWEGNVSPDAIRNAPSYPRITLLSPSTLQSSELLRTPAALQDLCIPYQRLQVESGLTVFTRLRTTNSVGFSGPCSLVLPSWTLEHLSESGFEIDVKVEEGEMVPVSMGGGYNAHRFGLGHPAHGKFAILVFACPASDGGGPLHASIAWDDEDTAGERGGLEASGVIPERCAGHSDHVVAWEERQRRFRWPSLDDAAVTLQFSVWDGGETSAEGQGLETTPSYALDVRLELPPSPEVRETKGRASPCSSSSSSSGSSSD